MVSYFDAIKGSPLSARACCVQAPTTSCAGASAVASSKPLVALSYWPSSRATAPCLKTWSSEAPDSKDVGYPDRSG